MKQILILFAVFRIKHYINNTISTFICCFPSISQLSTYHKVFVACYSSIQRNNIQEKQTSKTDKHAYIVWKRMPNFHFHSTILKTQLNDIYFRLEKRPQRFSKILTNSAVRLFLLRCL